MTEQPSAPATDEPTAPPVSGAESAPTDTTPKSVSPISEADYAALMKQIEAQNQSIEKLANKNSELIGKNKDRKTAAEKVLSENGEFKELSALQTATITEQNARIATLEADAMTGTATREAYEANNAEIAGYVTGELAGLNEAQLAQLNENLVAYGSGSLETLPPVRQLQAVKKFREQMALPNRIGDRGTGQTAQAREAQIAQARADGNIGEMMRLKRLG